MKYLIYLISIIILLGLNLGLFNNFQINGQIPNLLFLFSLCFSLGKSAKGGSASGGIDYVFFFISFISGLFLDFYSTAFFGGFTLAFLSISFLLHLLASNVMIMEFNWKTLSLALIVSLSLLDIIVWLYGLSAFKLNTATEYVSLKNILSGFPASLLYNWLLLYPMYLFSNYLKLTVDDLGVRRRGVIR